MNARLLAAFLCLTMASTGCIIVDHDDDTCCNVPNGQPGDVTFLWTFASEGAGRCADTPDVRRIRISIPGETLLNGGIYACNTAGVDGIVLHDFVPGNYSYTLEALSYTDQVLYRSGGTFSVNGDVRVSTTLTPNGSPGSFAYISWSFEGNTSSPNPSCYQAGVTHVDARIDNGEWARFSCAEGTGSAQVQSPFLAPGQHTIELVGVRVTSAGEEPFYHRTSTLTTQAGSPISVSYGLNAVGGLSLRWELIDGSISKTCAQSGVTQVTIHLYDETRKQYVYGDAGDVHPCNGAPIIYNFLRPGYYTVIMDGTGPGGVFYTNRYNSPPSRPVTAFVQETEGDAYTLFLPRRN
ncbi:hypothetical protein JRI60_12260 [Archangium violaceum]|uniref:hypothetical protein n=1 Tax=Archangium violaceum TaxID=83451 RepID=UPI0019529030|nr:hypothetical protein [Archangium violaceum]QRN99737.1 hypothetical protein JRI60_12260 [Archangium violaceum]